MLLTVCLSLALVVAAAAATQAGVTVAILPEHQTVAPGSEFEVSISVTEAGASFNAFGLVIGFDSNALTPVPISPLAAQVGSAMREACANVFHDFRVGASSDTVNCSMLCGGTSITGPGEIYRLRFRASPSPQVTTLRFLERRFYRSGVLLGPVTSSDAVIQIGSPLGVADVSLTDAWWLRVSPNPSREGALIEFAVATQAQIRLSVVDLQGREVAVLADGVRAAGRHQEIWSGRIGERAAPAGVYLVRYRVPGRDLVRRLAIMM